MIGFNERSNEFMQKFISEDLGNILLSNLDENGNTFAPIIYSGSINNIGSN